LARVIAVAVSPDGRHLYAAGFDDDALAVFSVSTAITYLPVVERDAP
jgi:6-phosphogluconolactonase (cycloisomerase 2 family)